MSNKALVAIVLSTYNGAHYLQEQLDSISAQDYPNIILIARDDGSADETVSILEEYAEHNRAIVLKGQNSGVAQSFMIALQHVPREASYIAFCDQDDVWHQNKISRGVSALEKADPGIPALYCTSLNACNERLEFINIIDLNSIGIDFPRMMYECVPSGNTMLFNRCLLEMAAAKPYECAYYHDWWLALIASAAGQIIYDRKPSLEYRRIIESVSAGNLSGIGLIAYRAKKFLFGNGLRKTKEQLASFEEHFGNLLNKKDDTELNKALHGSRAEKAFSPTRYRQSFQDEIALRLLFLAGKI